MAQTLTGAQYPQVVRFTLGGSDVATELNVPHTAQYLTIRGITNALKVAFVGVTDGGAIGATFITLTADASHQLSLRDGRAVSAGVTSVFVASAEASTVVECMVEG